MSGKQGIVQQSRLPWQLSSFGWVIHTDDGDIDNFWMLQQYAFQLGRRYLEALISFLVVALIFTKNGAHLVFDQLFSPVHDGVASLLVYNSYVTRLEPAIGRD